MATADDLLPSKTKSLIVSKSASSVRERPISSWKRRKTYSCLCLRSDFSLQKAAGVAGAGTTAASAAAATTTTSAAQASASSGSGYEFQIFLTLAAVGVLNAAVLLIHRHLRQAEAAGAAGNRRVPDAVAFLLLAAAGLLVHGVPGAVDDDVVAALGAAAFSALPGAATPTFFLGMMTLIFAARVHGGGGAVAGAGSFFGEIQGPLLRVLTKVAAGAAAALVFLVTVAAFCIKY